jgi:DNA-binding response OmpR family regulator
MNCQSIIIVDDEIEILNIVDVYLKNEGYNVFKA